MLFNGSIFAVVIKEFKDQCAGVSLRLDRVSFKVRHVSSVIGPTVSFLLEERRERLRVPSTSSIQGHLIGADA